MDVSRYETCGVHLQGTEAVWPAPVEAFLKSHQNAGVPDNNQLVITTPASGSSYLYLPDLDPQHNQRIPFTATFSNSSADLHWFVNDNYIGASKSGGTVFWPLGKGTHRIVCSDGNGKSRLVAISVK